MNELQQTKLAVIVTGVLALVLLFLTFWLKPISWILFLFTLGTVFIFFMLAVKLVADWANEKW